MSKYVNYFCKNLLFKLISICIEKKLSNKVNKVFKIFSI